MIEIVRGHVAEDALDSAVIEVGGLGMQVLCAPATLAGLRVGEPVRLPTSMVVREDSLTLFGFADDDERVLFELLQTASGVGPRLAQAMLAVHGPDALRRAVATEDLVGLTAVPGIGRKGAQRIVLELKDRIGAVPATPSPVESSRRSAWREQVQGALLGLGWTVREADAAVEAVAEQAVEPPDVPALLRAALRTLSRA